MKNPIPRRIGYALGFVACTGLILFALYLQHAKGEDPCPLCIFQRVAMTALSLVFLVGAIHDPQGQRMVRIYTLAGGVLAAIGSAIAARQIWLQHLPADQVPSCGPGLNYILKAHPFFNALAIVLKGSGECATIGWKFAGLAISEWSLLWFGILGAWAVLQSYNSR